MRLRLFISFVGLAFCGCDSAPSPSGAKPPTSFAAPESAAKIPRSTLTGRVVWTGSVPRLPPVTALRPDPNGGNVVFARPAPNLPAVSPDGGVANAVVFLRGVDPARSRPWDRPPVTVEMNDDRPMVREGDGPPTNIGFVHAGDEVTIVSRQPRFHSLRARGAAFWTVTLPQPDRPRSRRLDQPGVVELSSGANDFWMRGYLWVCDHPYYVTTDAAGRWAMSGVPAGEYELVAWRPDWRTVRQERDPETGLVCRYVFRPPLETSRTVILRDGETTPVGDIPIKP